MVGAAGESPAKHSARGSPFPSRTAPRPVRNGAPHVQREKLAS
jgi:hypothetical protein